MTRLWLAAAIIAIAVAMLARPGHPAPPAGADGSLSEWFRSLARPDTGGSCCSESDCRPVAIRVGPRGWEVLLEPSVFPIAAATWLEVPEAKIIRGKTNPTGRAVVCWSPSMGIMCLVEPAGA